MFSHDAEQSLQVVVDLVNTDPDCGGSEGLGSAHDIEVFVKEQHLSGIDPTDYDQIQPLHEVRRRLRELFGVSDQSAIAKLVNTLVAEAPMRPRLSNHDDYDWHLHYFAPSASLAEHLAVDGGMAVAHMVTAGETERLQVCAAPDCQAVFLDLSRNRSKRYCDARSCCNRLNVAAYRKRKRAAAHESGDAG